MYQAGYLDSRYGIGNIIKYISLHTHVHVYVSIRVLVASDIMNISGSLITTLLINYLTQK